MQKEVVLSEQNGSKRPVETLKKMLFTAQRLPYSSEENLDRDINDHHSIRTQSECLTEGEKGFISVVLFGNIVCYLRLTTTFGMSFYTNTNSQTL